VASTATTSGESAAASVSDEHDDVEADISLTYAFDTLDASAGTRVARLFRSLDAFPERGGSFPGVRGMSVQRRLTMLKPQLMRLGALTLVATTSAAFRGPLLAQGTQAAQEQVQLAFGYECDDRFLVRNDGSQNVTIEYNVAGSAERSQLQLKGKQSVEISSPSQNPLELRVGGKLVSTAH
jgi:hypothetical protein